MVEAQRKAGSGSVWFEIIYWLDDADDIYLCICMNDCKGGGSLEKGWGVEVCGLQQYTVVAYTYMFIQRGR